MIPTGQTEINPVHGGILETLVHEAVHHLLTPHRTPFFSIEVHELTILALEVALVKHINNTPSAAAWWYPRCRALMEPST